jgi:hypothetical protein
MSISSSKFKPLLGGKVTILHLTTTKEKGHPREQVPHFHYENLNEKIYFVKIICLTNLVLPDSSMYRYVPLVRLETSMFTV